MDAKPTPIDLVKRIDRPASPAGIDAETLARFIRNGSEAQEAVTAVLEAFARENR